MSTQRNRTDSAKRSAQAEQIWDREANELLRAILSLKSPGIARRFLRDLMTEDEIRMIARRWRAARMLHAGSPYRDVVHATGLSSRTVARISHWLVHGRGGYVTMIRRFPEMTPARNGPGAADSNSADTDAARVSAARTKKT